MTTPTLDGPLSERLWYWAREVGHHRVKAQADIEEAAAYIAAREWAEAQPEVADLLARAETVENVVKPVADGRLDCWAADLRALAACIVAGQKAEAKLAKAARAVAASREAMCAKDDVLLQDEVSELLDPIEAALRGEVPEPSVECADCRFSADVDGEGEDPGTCVCNLFMTVRPNEGPCIDPKECDAQPAEEVFSCPRS